MHSIIIALALVTVAAALVNNNSRGVHNVEITDDESNQNIIRQLGVEYVRRGASTWVQWKAEHNKTYANVDEERQRFVIYVTNLKYVDEHNAKFVGGIVNHRLKINHLADLTPEEYRQMLGFKRNYGDSLASGHGSTFLTPHNIQLPDEVDWRHNGYVTPVKNQGMCGSCWAFSTTGALEGQHMRKFGKLVSLSEQNLVDCSESYGNHGCNGGLMDQAFQYIKDNGGLDTEQAYPYEGKDDSCRFKKKNVGATDTGFVDVPTGNETALQEAVATVGPVSIAIDASQQSFQFYHDKVYIEPACDSQNLDHGVLVVGYGKSDDGQDYWLVKNSWGPKWGESGYIRMARNLKNQCGVATAASYPLE